MTAHSAIEARAAARRPRALRTLAALAASAAMVTSAPAQPPAAEPSVVDLATVAGAQLDQLMTREGQQAPDQMLLRNLSRYFARYVVPSNPDGLGRLLGTLERMTDRVALGIAQSAASYAAQEAGTEAGSEPPPVAARHVAPVLESLVPARPNPWGEAVFFPKAAPELQVAVELVDLQAFADTGLPWQRIAALGSSSEAPRRWQAEAVGLLAQGVNAYAFLVLRLGGEIAAAEYASELESRHLREAGDRLTERVQSHRDSPSLPPDPPLDAPPGELFRDVTDEAGIRFRHVTSAWLSSFRRYGFVAPTFSGGGVTAGDVDGDLDDDLVFCGGQGCALFLNDGAGGFTDATETAGIRVDGEARMAVLADLDNDGRRDLFVTYARDSNRLFKNLGGGRFEDVTARSGLAREGDVSGPAAAVDVDNDGLLDLFVGNFGNYLAGEHPWAPRASVNALPNRLYRNLGDLRFSESAEADVADTGWTQALSHVDYDRDGDQDLYIANDFGHNDLHVNDGAGRFRSAGVETGSDDPNHGMNVAFADLNGDELPDVFVTNIWFWNETRREATETNTLLLSSRDDAGRVAFVPATAPRLLQRDTGWAWGALFLDVELDGDDDLFVANGFTDYLTFIQNRPSPDDPDRLYPINNGREPNHFFRNDTGIPDLPLEDVGLELPGVNSRGIALLDADGDGDSDVAVSTFHSWAHLFRNEAPPPGASWLQLDLVGDPARGVNRDAIGAQVVARGDGLRVWRTLTGGEGYLSQSSATLAFGLATARQVDLEILWPNGERQSLPGVATGQRVRVTQGVAAVERVTPHTP